GVESSVHLEGLAGAYNRAAGRRVPRATLRRVRHDPVVRPLVGLVPRRVRARLGAVTGMESNEPTLSAATRDELAERLADEVRRLRPLMPSDFDGWGIA